MRQRQNDKLDIESQHARPYDTMNRMMLITILIVTNAAITGASSEIILQGSKNGPVSFGQKAINIIFTTVNITITPINDKHDLLEEYHY